MKKTDIFYVTTQYFCQFIYIFILLGCLISSAPLTIPSCSLYCNFFLNYYYWINFFLHQSLYIVVFKTILFVLYLLFINFL